MSVLDSIRPISSYDVSRPCRAALRLLGLVCLVTAAGACSDESFRPGPTPGPTPAPAPAPAPAGPTPSAPGAIVYQTAPIEGVVREVGGGPLAGQTVTLLGVTTNLQGARSAVTTSDGLGRFRFDGYASQQNQFPYVSSGKTGYVPVNWPVPKGVERPEPVSVTLRLQPIMVLTEDAPLHTTLSNDDTDYGWPDGPSWGLPVARGPVKVVFLRPTSAGPHTVRAEWSSNDRLSLWAEIYYREVNMEAFGNGSASLDLPTDWTRDPLNPVDLTIGLPRTSRTAGGLPGSINLTLTLTPKFPAP